MDAGPDAGIDAPSDAGPRDAGSDGGPSCSSPRVDETFEVAPDLGDTQIHANAAFDGQAVWVAFNVPEETGTGLFDVHAVRLGCDGEPLAPPFRVNTTIAPNDVDPSIAVGTDGVLIAWMSDDGTGVDNLDVRYRVFGRDGTPLMADDRALETSHAGMPVTGNVMSPFAAALPDGGFAIAASRGLPEAMGFQVFLQRLDGGGAFSGDAVDGFLVPTADQTGATVAAGPAGSLRMAWVQNDGSGDQVVEKVVDDGTAMPEVAVPSVVRSGGPYLAGDGTHVYLALSAGGETAAEIRLTDLEADPGTEARFGGLSHLHHSPVVVPGSGGGWVAYHRVMSGIRNEVFVAAFTDDGGGITGGVPVQVPTGGPAAPYAPALASVGSDIVLVAWSEGVSPAFRLKARFMTVAP